MSYRPPSPTYLEDQLATYQYACPEISGTFPQSFPNHLAPPRQIQYEFLEDDDLMAATMQSEKTRKEKIDLVNTHLHVNSAPEQGLIYARIARPRDRLSIQQVPRKFSAAPILLWSSGRIVNDSSRPIKEQREQPSIHHAPSPSVRTPKPIIPAKAPVAVGFIYKRRAVLEALAAEKGKGKAIQS